MPRSWFHHDHGLRTPHRLLQAYDLLHVQKGEPAAARERLEGALAIFRRLGAREDAEQTEHLLTTHPYHQE